jgi:hypothetical protein
VKQVFAFSVAQDENNDIPLIDGNYDSSAQVWMTTSGTFWAEPSGCNTSTCKLRVGGQCVSYDCDSSGS